MPSGVSTSREHCLEAGVCEDNVVGATESETLEPPQIRTSGV